MSNTAQTQTAADAPSNTPNKAAANRFKIAVLVSGNGSNLQALIDCDLALDILVISNKACAYAITRAKQHNLPFVVLETNPDGNRYKRAEFEQLAIDNIRAFGAQLVVLAGFMKILTPLFVDTFNQSSIPNNIPLINLHPSLLPLYKGTNTHARVLQTGDKWHGCSVHFVTQDLDAGAVIASKRLLVDDDDTAQSLQQRVHKLEHTLLVQVVGWFAYGLIDINSGKSLALNLPLHLAADE